MQNQNQCYDDKIANEQTKKELVLAQYNNFLITQQQGIITYKMTTVHHSHTLFDLVDCIKLKKFKLSRSSTPETDEEEQNTSKYWSDEEEHLFFNIVLKYGADYSILKHHFPTKTRSQIKRKCGEIEKRRKRAIEKVEEIKKREERKQLFDREVMQLDMIKWRNSKPNKPENAIVKEI